MACLLLAMAIISCGRSDREILVTVPYQADFEIPAGLNPALEHVVTIPNLSNSFLGLLNQNGIDTARIVSVEAGRGDLIEISGIADLNFVLDVEVILFTDNNTDDGKEIYFRENLPLNTGSTINLFQSLSNVEDLVFRENLGVEIRFRRLRAPSPATLNIRFQFELSALE